MPQLLCAWEIAQHCHASHTYLKQFHTEERSHVLWTSLYTFTYYNSDQSDSIHCMSITCTMHLHFIHLPQLFPDTLVPTRKLVTDITALSFWRSPLRHWRFGAGDNTHRYGAEMIRTMKAGSQWIQGHPTSSVPGSNAPPSRTACQWSGRPCVNQSVNTDMIRVTHVTLNYLEAAGSSSVKSRISIEKRFNASN